MKKRRRGDGPSINIADTDEARHVLSLVDQILHDVSDLEVYTHPSEQEGPNILSFFIGKR